MRIIGFKTIAYMCPAVFVIEMGEMHYQRWLAEHMENIHELIQAGAAMYTIQTVRNSTPALSGYPTRRNRLFIIGWRVDISGTTAT